VRASVCVCVGGCVWCVSVVSGREDEFLDRNPEGGRRQRQRQRADRI